MKKIISENSINEENNQPGILYNQIISEENEEFNSENNERSNKNKKIIQDILTKKMKKIFI